MHRSELRDDSVCADCGAQIAAGRERGFALSAGVALCFACAVERGGVYDEQRDAWTQAPDTADLPPAED